MMTAMTKVRTNSMTRSLTGTAFVLLLAGCTNPGTVESRTVAQTTTTQPAAQPATQPKPEPAKQAPLKPFAQEIAGAAFKFEMVAIPGSGTGDGGGGAIKPFFMSAKEITWEAFDPYVYRLDEDAGKAPPSLPGNPDAVTRPSKPYLPPDRGFGHEGYAAITMSHQNAAAFCVWLSAHSGRSYRLATEAEWEHAARAGAKADPGDIDAAKLDELAWTAANSGNKPHPVGTKKPNAYGLYDMLGNVREWCTGTDGKGVTKGGAYNDPPEKVKAALRMPYSAAWNASDPQIPKSKWWLADGNFVGFRIVCDADETGAPAKFVPPPPPPKPVDDGTPKSPERK